MPYSQYPTIQHAWFGEVWNSGNEAAIDDLCAEDVIGHGLTDPEGNEVRSIEGFKAFYRTFISAFPDIQIEVLEAISDGETTVSRCHVRAHHTGEGFLLEPTGAPVDFTGICWVKLRDGKIAESWNSFDFLTLVQQIGAIEFKR